MMNDDETMCISTVMGSSMLFFAFVAFWFFASKKIYELDYNKKNNTNQNVSPQQNGSIDDSSIDDLSYYDTDQDGESAQNETCSLKIKMNDLYNAMDDDTYYEYSKLKNTRRLQRLQKDIELAKKIIN